MGLVSTFVCGCLVATLVYLLFIYLGRNKKWWSSRGVPDMQLPSWYSRIFKKTTFLEVEHSLYKQSTSPFGGYMEMFKPTLYVRDLDLCKNIYVKDFDHFVNRRSFNVADQILIDMLTNKVDGEWKQLRSAMTPTFTTGKIRKMFPIMNESSKKLTSYLMELTGKDGGMVDFEDALGRYAMDVISSVVFGMESQVFRYKDSIVAKMAKKLQFKTTPLFMLKFAITLMNDRLAKLLNVKFMDQEAGDFFSKAIKDVMKHREISGEKRNDFLQMMIDVKNGQLQADRENEEMDTYEKDAQLSEDSTWKKGAGAVVNDDLIVSNCIMFIFGGIENTQATLHFGVYALARNLEVQQTLRRELQEATRNTDGELTYDIVNRAEYLDKFVQETLRMYPPAMRTERRCTKDYILPNKTIVPKETMVIIPVLSIHHDEKHFPNPKVFDPERFSPEEKAKRHPYAYMPFGHGPRNCIANRFVMVEAKAALANLVLNFDLEPCAKTSIPMVYANNFSLKPRDGMWLKMTPRVK